MLALVDADVLVYSSAAAAQKTQYHVTYGGVRRTFANAKADGNSESYKTWAKANEIPLGDLIVEPEVNVLPISTALMIARTRLDQILEAVGATAWELYATGDHNFRHAVAVTKPYKGNRDQPKPIYFGEVFDYYLRRGVQVVDGMEADDMLGIRQVECERSGTPSCICSIDKDLWQIPGRHYSWGLDEGKQRFVVPAFHANRWFMQQLISGDATDNVPGLRGWGAAKAAKFVAGFETPTGMWEGVKELYKEVAGPAWAPYLLEQGRLLWIRRERDQQWSVELFNEEVKRV